MVLFQQGIKRGGRGQQRAVSGYSLHRAAVQVSLGEWSRVECSGEDIMKRHVFAVTESLCVAPCTHPVRHLNVLHAVGCLFPNTSYSFGFATTRSVRVISTTLAHEAAV